MIIILLLLAKIADSRDMDLIEQEITQVEYLIQLQEEKLHYLKELRNMYTDNNQSIPSIDSDLLNELVTTKPNKSQMNGKSQELLERQFTNRMLKKYSFNITSNISESSLIPTFQYKSQSESTFTQMLYVITKEQMIELYDLNNVLITSQKLRFQPQYIQTSGRADDPIICLTNEQGEFDLLRIENAKVVIENTEGKPKTKFSVQISLETQLQVDQIANQSITSLTYSMVKGLKYIIFGTKEGSIYVYHRNGTYIGDKHLNTTLKNVYKSYPNTLFQTSNGFGYINPVSLELIQPQCENLPFKLMHLTQDIQQSNIVYALSDQDEVYVFEIRMNEQCRMKQKLTQAFSITMKQPKIISLRQYLIVFDQDSRRAILYNTSEILQPESMLEQEQPILLEYFNNPASIKTTLNPIKGNGASHYLISVDSFSSSNIVSYYEIVMPQKKETDFFSNFRFPIIILAIVLVLVYQFWFKGTKQEKKSNKKGPTLNEEEEIEQLLKGGKFNPKKQQSPPQQQQTQPKQVKFTDDLRKLDRFKEQLDSLDQKTKQLNEKVGVQNQIDSQRQKIAQSTILQNKKYV